MSKLNFFYRLYDINWGSQPNLIAGSNLCAAVILCVDDIF
jgi:hypothetical protein